MSSEAKADLAAMAQSKAEKVEGEASGQEMWFWFQLAQLWLALGARHLWWTDTPANQD